MTARHIVRRLLGRRVATQALVPEDHMPSVSAPHDEKISKACVPSVSHCLPPFGCPCKAPIVRRISDLAASGKFWLSYPLILVIGISWGIHAWGAQVEIGLGQSRAHTTNSVWYEDGLPHQLSITPPAYMIGVTGDWMPSIAWHADFVDLGRMSVDSWDVPNDRAQYDFQHGGCMGKCPALVHVLGSGQVLGMAFTAEPHLDIGRSHIGLEAGPFVYLSQWQLSVPNWKEATGVSGNAEWNGTSSLTYSSTLRPVLGGVVGLSISRGRWGLSLRHYFVRKTPGNFPAVWTFIDTLMATYAFN